MRTIIISGEKTDIDVLACAVAYRNFLKLSGKEAFISISNEFGGTIPESVWDRGFSLDQTQIIQEDKIIAVDVSDPNAINPAATQDNIIEIRDHHPGYEAYRKEKLGEKSIIEDIGACATLIYEEIKRHGLIDQLEQYSKDLLMTAILSNTLNFKARITQERDRKAYEELQKISKLPYNRPEMYFGEVEKNIIKKPNESITNDTKVLDILGKKITIGQIELRESYNFMKENQTLIEDILVKHGNENWFYTSPSISEGINYLFTRSDFIKELLSEKIGAKFEGDFGTTERLWLRKEIWKEII